MKYSADEILEFIRNCAPHFYKMEDGRCKMFTVCTQWVDADSFEELVEYGVEEYKERGNTSPIQHWLNNLNVEELKNLTKEIGERE